MNTELQQKAENQDQDLLLAEIKLGIDSALAIFGECTITVPSDHPDPGAMTDCKNNVHTAKASFEEFYRKYQLALQEREAEVERLKEERNKATGGDELKAKIITKLENQLAGYKDENSSLALVTSVQSIEIDALKQRLEELEAEKLSFHKDLIAEQNKNISLRAELEAQPSPPVELTEFIRRYVDIDSLDEPYVIGIEELTKAALSATPQPSPTVQEPSTEHKKEGGGQ
jgi:DNA repair exonuclease SbcCD ATPase subunit